MKKNILVTGGAGNIGTNLCNELRSRGHKVISSDIYNTELDEWRDLCQGATDTSEKLEQRERERTGIATLKIGYNRVHGFYIEVSRAYSEQIPVEYVRR